MAQFTLNIYGENDEITKTYETNIVRFGMFLEAVEVYEHLEAMSSVEQFKAVSQFVKRIFVGITDEDLANADYNDVFNVFMQLVNRAAKINVPQSKGTTGKNLKAAK